MSEQNNERDAFESWLPECWPKDRFVDQEGDELYAEEWVQGAWIGWQARANHSGDAAAMVARQSAEPVALTDEMTRREEFASLRDNGHFDMTTAADAWGRTVFKHEHIESRYQGWLIARNAYAIAATGAQGLTQADKKRIAQDVQATCSLIPGTTHYNAAEMAIDAILAQCAPAATAPSDGARQGVQWDLFPGWLIDHHEGETITEELLQFALADMLKAHPVAAAAQKDES